MNNLDTPIEILVLGPNDNNLKKLSEELSLLEKISLKLTCSTFLNEGKSLLKTRKFDLVFFNPIFIENNFHESLTSISSWLDFKTTPFIFFTTDLDSEQIEHITELGFADYLTTEDLNSRPLSKTLKSSISNHQLKRDLEKTKSELASTNKELKEFTYIVSHDLRAPLRHINSFSGFLMEDLKDNAGATKETLHFAEIILKSGEKLNLLLDELLSYTSIIQKQPNLQKFKVYELITETLETFTLQIANEQAKIELSIDPKTTIIADRIGLGQVFQNLISNALKYKKTNINSEILINLIETSSEWIFSVKDNGLGIPEKDQEKVFKIFARLHDSSEIEGTGLGLSICHKIISLHGGKIWIEHDDHPGVIFKFSLSKDVGAGNSLPKD